jgi:hypothetical protein
MTSIVHKFLAWISPAHHDALVASGRTLEADAVGLVSQVAHALESAVVATEQAAEQTTIGQLVIAACKAVGGDAGMTSEQKLASVVETAIPLVLQVATSGGIAATADQALTLAKTLAQNVYANEVSTTAGAFAAKLAPVVGVKLPG